MAILDFRSTQKKRIRKLCKNHLNIIHAQLWFHQVTNFWEKKYFINFRIVFPGPMLNYIMQWQSSWILYIQKHNLYRVWYKEYSNYLYNSIYTFSQSKAYLYKSHDEFSNLMKMNKYDDTSSICATSGSFVKTWEKYWNLKS